MHVFKIQVVCAFYSMFNEWWPSQTISLKLMVSQVSITIIYYNTKTTTCFTYKGGGDPALLTNYSAWCLRECHSLSRLVSQLHTGSIGYAVGPHPTVRANTDPPQTGVDLHRPHPIHGTTNETNIKVRCNTYSDIKQYDIEDGMGVINCSNCLFPL